MIPQSDPKRFTLKPISEAPWLILMSDLGSSRLQVSTRHGFVSLARWIIEPICLAFSSFGYITAISGCVLAQAPASLAV